MLKKGLLLIGMVLVAVGGGVNFAHALPIIDQTGNLVLNGNFETGTYSSWLTNHSPTVSVSTEKLIDGAYSAFIDTTSGIYPESVGIYQFPGQFSGDTLPGGTYTASGWFYTISRQAKLGIVGKWGHVNYQSFSEPTTSLNEWQFLQLTFSTDGPIGLVCYGVSDQDMFYVDGLWLNQDSTNLSPYAPQNGFSNPNISQVPEPDTLLLLGTGLVGVMGLKGRNRS